MVQCDRCDTWWHFGCVGVDESVSERSFICPKCENSTSLLQSQPTTGVELIPPMDSISLTSRRSSVSNASARARLNLEKLEVKKALAEKTLNLERREQERKLELARLQNEGELERKKLELQREYEEERIRLMEEELVEEEERSVRSQQSSSSKVRQWRSQLQFGGACSTMRYPAANEARGERNVKMTTTTTTAASDVPVSQPLNSTSRLTEEAANNHQQAGDAGNGFEVQALPKAKTCIGTGAVPKQLPTSTPTGEIVKSFPPPSMPSACGYTDAENLIRLQRCLKGTALEAVRSRLLFPAAVPHVIATLETLYGKPEHLIFMLVKKVREVLAPKSDKLKTLIGFGMAIQNLCDHVEMGQQETHLNNLTLLYELTVDKIPSHLRLDWALFKQEAPVTNLRTFAQFMSRLVTAAADVTLHIEPRAMQKVKLEKPREKIFLGAHAGSKHINDATKMSGSQGHSGRSENSIVCLVCKDTGHKVRECKQFGDMTVDERWKTIQAYSLCRTCIGAHGKRPCKSKKLCDIEGCQAKHHTLLHSTQTRSEVSEPIRGIMNHHHAARSSLFRILPVTLFANNRSIVVYAFLDEGSSRTLIEEDVIKRLGVDGEPSPLCLQWTANIKRFEKNSRKVSLEIAGGSKNYRYQLFDAQTVNRLDLPRQSMRYAEMVAKYPYLEGLPIEDYANAVPKILIGNDHSHLGASLKIREGNPQEPIAAKSRLGWTIYGSVSGASERALSFHICSCETNASLHELVKKYFSIESLGVKAIDCPESKEVQRANRILQHTTRRVGQRYETGLIWKYDTIKFPDSYQMAKKRMLCLERRMAKNSIIGNSVKKQMIEYQEKGYIHPATEAEMKEADPQKIWYLPLGVALNPKKPDKIRIFCDAAAMVEGVSLNSMLLKGPDLISSLPVVLFGFREKRYAICADIKEMFHQIQIRKEDRNAQRLLWRDDTETEPVTYIMDVATFGSTCSPCSAQYVKNLNASSQAVEFPRAADAIIRKHYVDDYLDSADTIDEAVQLAKDVRTVHFRGGFHIRNWMSNSGEVLRRVGETSSATKKDLVLDRTSATERILGMLWSPEQDEFSYSASMLVAQQRPTKRIVLRVVMSLFDPLGLMSFFVIHGKILIQDIWRAKTEWDEPIPEKLCQRWWQWTKLCEQLDCIRIARCYFPDRHTNEFLSLQLHVFVDASEGAYACVAYLRAEYDGTVECALVAAKSKVAPLKSLSIPRLELQAAVLGVRLQKMIRQAHGLAIGECFYHTDSKNVLAWIKSDHRNYRQFVAVRVGEILTESTEQEWRWVPSKENVADDATKSGSLAQYGVVEFHSDNGTNFVGASNDLRKELTNVNAELAETFTNSTTRWCFIPPSAPHMGGAWERLVRSIKTALQAMYTTRIPDEETFGTLIVEAESIVNSRPLTFVPVDPNQEEALTPNHFLLLSSRGVTQPVKSLAEPGQACKSSWNLCRIMVDSFWRRWIREYLPTIARRTKWFEEVKPVDVGDLVIVVTEVARNGWIRGRIIEVIRGRDGRIRQAVVQTSKGVIRRPIAKLAVLDVMNSNVAQKKSGTSYESGNVENRC
ncbi:uncharacterized protein LOC134205954 [Armigeres subalbatus]|uniref:uncharacterized protein LOC134205954 n=1 Tax=Armigeres subalbatus TaxID=124917 RepID=UPI002ED037FC